MLMLTINWLIESLVGYSSNKVRLIRASAAPTISLLFHKRNRRPLALSRIDHQFITASGQILN